MSRRGGARQGAGRPKGTRDKVNVGRELIVRGITSPIPSGLEAIADSLSFMGEAMLYFVQLARKEKEEDRKRELYRDVVYVADRLAPYRYPKYATLKIGTGGESSVLVEDGVSGEELLSGLMEFMEENGIPKTRLKDVTPNGVANR